MHICLNFILSFRQHFLVHLIVTFLRGYLTIPNRIMKIHSLSIWYLTRTSCWIMLKTECVMSVMVGTSSERKCLLVQDILEFTLHTSVRIVRSWLWFSNFWWKYFFLKTFYLYFSVFYIFWCRDTWNIYFKYCNCWESVCDIYLIAESPSLSPRGFYIKKRGEALQLLGEDSSFAAFSIQSSNEWDWEMGLLQYHGQSHRCWFFYT